MSRILGTQKRAKPRRGYGVKPLRGDVGLGKGFV